MGLVSGIRFGLLLSGTTAIPQSSSACPSSLWALANSEAHSPLCLLCAGVPTSPNNAALCLFFRREEGRDTLTGKAVFFSCSVETHAHEDTQSCLSHLEHANNWAYVRLVSRADAFILCAFPRKTRDIIHFLHHIQKYFNIISLV